MTLDNMAIYLLFHNKLTHIATASKVTPPMTSISKKDMPSFWSSGPMASVVIWCEAVCCGPPFPLGFSAVGARAGIVLGSVVVFTDNNNVLDLTYL